MDKKSTLIEFTARDGTRVLVDTSPKACRVTGFLSGEKMWNRYKDLCTFRGVGPVSANDKRKVAWYTYPGELRVVHYGYNLNLKEEGFMAVK